MEEREIRSSIVSEACIFKGMMIGEGKRLVGVMVKRY